MTELSFKKNVSSFCSRERLYIKAFECNFIEQNQRINSMLHSSSLAMVHKILLVLNVLPSIVSAFWRLPCYSRLGVFRIDPIVSERLPSQHAHTLHGGQSTFRTKISTQSNF
jgi:hypothetical protein